MDDKLIEAAARKLCELRGVDPDIGVKTLARTPEGIIIGPSRLSHNEKVWHGVAAEIQMRLQMDEAISFAVIAVIEAGKITDDKMAPR